MKKGKALIWFFLAIMLISFFSFYRLLRPGYFSMQDDIQVFRLQQFDECFQDGQIPCRYISKGGLGFGYPLYNYYSSFPYALGEAFHLLGFSFIDSIKLIFILGFILSSLGMFLWARIYWGNWGGLTSAIFYLFAPYHAVDSYVRGALGEFWALTIFPYLFLFLALSFKDSKRKVNWLFFSLSLAVLFLTHNLAVIAIFPVLLIYFLFLLFPLRQKLNYFLNFLISLALSLLISSFFLLPVLFERKLVTLPTMTEGFFDFRGHFVSLYQLFISRFWGYGASLFGTADDGMSFQIGLLQWLVPAIVLLIYFFKIIRKKMEKDIEMMLFSFFVFAGLCFSFLAHNQSTFIWKSLPFLAYFQFPWRFLMVVIFCFSFAAGTLIKFFSSLRLKMMVAILLILAVIILNIGYFREDIWYPDLSDQGKLSGAELIRQSGAGIKDYWPIFGITYPKEFAPEMPYFTEGNGGVKQFSKKSNFACAGFSVFSEEARVVLPIVYFPNWQLLVDGRPVEYDLDKELGLIQVRLDQGEHQIALTFYDTKIRRIGNRLSLFGLFLIPLWGFYLRKRSNEKT